MLIPYVQTWMRHPVYNIVVSIDTLSCRYVSLFFLIYENGKGRSKWISGFLTGKHPFRKWTCYFRVRYCPQTINNGTKKTRICLATGRRKIPYKKIQRIFSWHTSQKRLVIEISTIAYIACFNCMNSRENTSHLPCGAIIAC